MDILVLPPLLSYIITVITNYMYIYIYITDLYEWTEYPYLITTGSLEAKKVVLGHRSSAHKFTRAYFFCP